MATVSKRKRSSTTDKPPPRSPSPPPPTTDNNRRSRVFSKEDEIHLLNVFFDIIKHSPPPSTAATSLWNRVGKSLSSEITQTQLIEKLRKMRQKYSKQIVDQTLIKTPHERVIFDLSHKVWGEDPSTGRSMASPSPKKTSRKPQTLETLETLKPSRTATVDVVEKKEEEPSIGNHTQGKTHVLDSTEEEDFKNAKIAGEKLGLGFEMEKRFPCLMDQVFRFPESLGMGESLKLLKGSDLEKLEKRWRLLQIAEAKVSVQRAELVKEQTQLMLEGLGVADSKV